MTLNIEIKQVSFPEEFKPKTSKPKKSKIDRGLNILAEATGNSNILKIAKTGIEIAATIGHPIKNSDELLSHHRAIENISGFLDLFTQIKDLSNQIRCKLPKDPQKARTEKRDRNWAIARAVFGIAIAIMKGMKLVDTYGISYLEKISERMGGTPAGTIFSFGNALTALMAIKLAIGVALSIRKIRAGNQKRSRAIKKQQFWKNPLTDEKIAERQKTLADKKESLRASLQDLAKNSDALGTEIEKLSKKFESKKIKRSEKSEKLKHLSPLSKKIEQIKLFFKHLKPSKTKRLLKEAIEKHSSSQMLFEVGKRTYIELEAKETSWGQLKDAISTGVSKNNQEMIQAFQVEKSRKWQVKQIHLRQEKIEEGCSIALTIIFAITLIASAILSASGIGLMAASLTLSSVFLLYYASSLGFNVFKKMRKTGSSKKVPMPTLTASTAV